MSADTSCFHTCDPVSWYTSNNKRKEKVQVTQKVLESPKEPHTCDLDLDFHSLKTLTPIPSDPTVKEGPGPNLNFGARA